MSDVSPTVNLNLLFGAMVSSAASGGAPAALSNSQSFKTIIAEAVKRVEAGEAPPFAASGKGLPQDILARLSEQLQGTLGDGLTEEVLPAEGPETAQQALLALLKEALESGELLPPDGNALPAPLDGRAILLPEFMAVLDKNLLAGEGKSAPVLPSQAYKGIADVFQSLVEGDSPTARPEFNDRVIFQQLLGQAAGKSEPGSQDAGLVLPDKLPSSAMAPQNGQQPSAPSANLMQQNLPPAAGEHRPSLRLDVPMGQPGWDAEMAGRVRWLVQNNAGSAEIRLNPPELGPVEVRIKTDGDQTSVLFTAHHSATRDALEQALPRLREAFASSGLQLADANVAEHGLRGGQQQHPSSGSANPFFAGGELAEAEQATGVAQIAAGTGLIDFYI